MTDIKNIMDEYVEAVKDIYGSNLQRIILYGLYSCRILHLILIWIMM